MQNTTETHKKTGFNPTQANAEARKRLQKSIPKWLKDGWTLHPFIIGINKKDPKKKLCIPLTTDGKKESPRIIIKTLEDLPPTANAILGLSQIFAILDIDREFKPPLGFPVPFMRVKTGIGEHLYFLNGDLKGPHKLIFGECQYKDLGVFMPGSYHAPTGSFYEQVEYIEKREKLFFKDIKPFLLKEKDSTTSDGTWKKGTRNNTLFKKIAMDLSKNKGRNIPDIIDKAEKSGLDQNEIRRTAESASKAALNDGIEPDPKKDQNTKTTKKKTKPLDDPRTVFKKLKEDLINSCDMTKQISPTFWDSNSIFPKNSALLLSGDTESGKTAFCLNFLKDQLNNKVPCAIWEHSETNRLNRLNKWMDNTQPQTKPLITPHKQEIIDFIKPGHIILIDDTDSFFRIKNTIDRREVADSLDDISWICQLAECTFILCHYQTKASKGEKTSKTRSGGSMAWLNKVRYAAIIEIGLKEITSYENELQEKRNEQKEASFLTIQKGHRPKAPEFSWWLKSSYTIGEPITKDKVAQILKEKVEGQDTFIYQIDRLISDYMKDSGENKMPTKDFYTLCFSNFGIKRSQAHNYLLKFNKYKIDSPGFGPNKKSYITTS